MRIRDHIGSIVLLLVLIMAGVADFACGTDALLPGTRAHLTTPPNGWEPVRLPIVGLATDVNVGRLQTPAAGMGLGLVLRY